MSILKPRARIIKILGEELISSEVIAIVELVKNSYDADATEVNINLDDVYIEAGTITVTDDGIGMSEKKIKTVWLEPGTPDKKTNKPGENISKCFKRKMLGEKGIGRFSANRLGNNILLVSRATLDCFETSQDYETEVAIDWSDFTEEIYLEDVPITIVKRKPQFFADAPGTLIRITSLRPWNKITTRRVINKLRSLESPNWAELDLKQNFTSKTKIAKKKSKDPGFSVNILSNNKDITSLIKSIKPISEILPEAFYTFSGIIDKTGILTFEYSFNRPDQPHLSQSIKNQKINLCDFNADFFEEALKTKKLVSDSEKKEEKEKEITPGNFEIRFFVWDLESAALKISNLTTTYKEIIRPNGGVRVYRDNFRVWPYGEEDDDWLGLDLRRVNQPGSTISRNQIIGFVNITSKNNPHLIDQSNREGLQRTIHYEVFYEWVRASIKHFGSLRKQDKDRIEVLNEKRKGEDIVIQRIQELNKKVIKNKHSHIYGEDINDLEIIYDNHIKDILERFLLAASFGIAYTLPIHEIKNRINTVDDLILEIKDNPKFADRYLRELYKSINDIKTIVDAVSNIMGRKKWERIKLADAVTDAIILKQRELNKYDISIDVKIITAVKVYMIPGLIRTAVFNLIDNSIYWIRVKQIEKIQKGLKFHGKIEILVDENDKAEPFITVKDNGKGIIDSLEVLIQPSYSRKTDGLGLGLHLVDEIIHRHGGYLVAYNDEGAVFEMVFKKQGEKNE